MEQYEFRGLGINERGDPHFLPSEAMFLVQNGVGTPIEDMIDGYQTLNVTGRELMAYSVQTQTVVGLDGSLFQYADYPTRDITIKYKFEAKSDKEFREKYSRLNYLLSQKELEFYFFDDVEYSYIGTLSDSQKPEPGSNTVVSEFTITCSNPFKILRKPTTYSGIGKTRINEPIYFPTVPDSIKLELNSDASHIEVSNGRETIKLTGSFEPDDVVVLKPSLGEISLNNESKLELLDLDSDFENFRVELGTVITVNPNCKVSLKLRRLSM